MAGEPGAGSTLGRSGDENHGLKPGLAVALAALLICVLLGVGAALSSGRGSVAPSPSGVAMVPVVDELPAPPSQEAVPSGSATTEPSAADESIEPPSIVATDTPAPVRTPGRVTPRPTPRPTPTPTPVPTPTKVPTPTPVPTLAMCNLNVLQTVAKMYYASGSSYYEYTAGINDIKAKGTAFPTQHLTRASRQIQQTTFLTLVGGTYDGKLVMMNQVSTDTSKPYQVSGCPWP